MDAMTKAMLNEAGFESGTVSELLGLDAVQEGIVESKVRLTNLLRDQRKVRGWSQKKLAQELATRQQVIARAEMGHRSVTLDLLFRCLLALGVSLSRIAREIEASETFLSEQTSGVELVDIAPIPRLIRPERIAANNSTADVKPLMELVKTSFAKEETSSASAANHKARQDNAILRAA